MTAAVDLAAEKDTLAMNQRYTTLLDIHCSSCFTSTEPTLFKDVTPMRTTRRQRKFKYLPTLAELVDDEIDNVAVPYIPLEMFDDAWFFETKIPQEWIQLGPQKYVSIYRYELRAL